MGGALGLDPDGATKVLSTYLVFFPYYLDYLYSYPLTLTLTVIGLNSFKNYYGTGRTGMSKYSIPFFSLKPELKAPKVW